jgi:hypothetical protein
MQASLGEDTEAVRCHCIGKWSRPGNLYLNSPMLRGVCCGTVVLCQVWNFLRVMGVPTNKLHACGYISIGCEPCTRPVLPNQHEREGRWWWEDATGEQPTLLCGTGRAHFSPQRISYRHPLHRHAPVAVWRLVSALAACS